ncbi:MAG TPA: hypothetical protein VFS20_17450 [Longimicrobium sp.]|nr:hypothetical protein [Longimicrobium sp.]
MTWAIPLWSGDEFPPVRSLVDRPVDEAAASVALLALRAALPGGASVPRRFVLLPDAEPVEPEEAAARLAALPKPVHCLVKARDDAVAVRCNAISWAPDFVRVIIRGREETYRSGGVRRVLFLGSDDAVLVTVEAAIRLEWDYKLWINRGGDVLGSRWLDMHGLTELAKRAGADFIQVYHETGEIPEAPPEVPA